jgi:hypothetical protein
VTGDKLEEALVVASPTAFAALADELQGLAGNRPASAAHTASANSQQGNFTAADRERLQELFGHLEGSLSDGIETDIAEIRSAVSAIPPSAISAEADWTKLARALAHEAAVHKAQAEELWEILDTASRPARGYNEPDNRNRWLRYVSEALDRDKPITIATVFGLARKHGWTGHVSPAPPALAMHAPVAAGAPRAIPITSLPRTPKKREWLCGTYLMRGAITLLSAPGARGKTSLLMTLAISCASGKPLLGAHLFGGPKTVLYLSAEEGTEEINLRLRAAMQHHGISEADLYGLHVIGAERWGLPLVAVNKGTPCADEKGWATLGAELDHLRADILIIDPLINFLGGADANNNSVAGLLMSRLATEAATRNLSVMIAHHVAKGRDPAAAESAMGAASFVNLSRISLSIAPLQEEDAGTVGLPPWEAKVVFRVLGTKQNYTPVKSDDDWFRFTSVEVQNAQPPTYPTGDSVGVVERFIPQASGAAAFPEALLRSALEAIQDADPPLTPSAQSKTRYAVPVIARAIAPHRGGKASEPEAKAVLSHLIDAGLASVEERKINREGGRSDMRKGLFPTATGAELLRRGHGTPQSPQSPADTSAGTVVDAGGDQPCGSPATQGGYGGKCGGEYAGPEPISHAVPKPLPKVKTKRRSGPQPVMDLTGHLPGSGVSEPQPESNITGCHQPNSGATPRPMTGTMGARPVGGIILSVGEPDELY